MLAAAGHKTQTVTIPVIGTGAQSVIRLMLISFGYDISLRLEVETTVLFCLRVHPSRRKDIVSGENFQIEPHNPFEEYLNGFGNICGRVHRKPGIIRFVNQGIIRGSG